ncbi:hypothetical protein NQ318_014938 [Aromia moschata]|uniref:Uncharacterized protein n=1 Tax=Aromia moschata TaxID=1265417 RepID=A0AAV8X278_9CUCU|nr:hypothetical protein NQ318_014938 [Aromia moschata]
MGHVRKIPSKRQAVVDDDTKLNLLLALGDNPITPARQLARDSNLNHKTAPYHNPVNTKTQNPKPLGRQHQTLKLLTTLPLAFVCYEFATNGERQKFDLNQVERNVNANGSADGVYISHHSVMDQNLFSLKSKFPGRSNQIDQLYDIFGFTDEPFPDSVYIYGGPSTGKSTVLLSESVVDLNKSVIVLDKSEELRNMDSNILAALLRLRELSGIRIAVIFLSEIVFEKYYSRANIAEPIKIYFPQYNKDELLEILSLDVDCARALLMNNFDEAFDFELRHMSRINFVKYCEPIINKENTINDSMALWRNIAPILKSSLEVLYLRVDSIAKNNDHQKSLASKGKLSQSFELPYYAKYLLIAAYLASYNSAKEE